MDVYEPAEGSRSSGLRLVLLSPEPWNEVSRSNRNQLLVRELLRAHSDLEVLWVEPPARLRHRRSLAASTPTQLLPNEGRLRVLSPGGILPRSLRPRFDEARSAQVRTAINRVGFIQPVLLVADSTYAPLVRKSEWRAVYDITDRLLDASIPSRLRRRLEAREAELIDIADDVVEHVSADELWEMIVVGRRLPRAGRRFRVLFVGHTAVESGGELALARLLPGMGRVDAHVVLGEHGPMVKRFRDAGATVEVLAIDELARSVKRDVVAPGRLPVAAILAVARHTWALSLRIREIGPDVIHTNTLKAAIYGGFAGRLARVPVVWHIRDRIAPDYLPGFAVWAIRTLGRLIPAAIITNSMSTRSTLGSTTRMVAVTPSPVVYDAVATAVPPVGPSGANVVIGMVGRLAAWKGQDVFVRAFARAFPDGPERAIIVGGALFGEDDFAAELTTLIADLGLSDRIELTGHVDDVPAELARMHVVVHASVIPEPFGQVVVEAMAAGRPVIASSAGGPAEIIEDGIDGLLVRPGDVADLADAMTRLARDSVERDRLGRAARIAVERFRPERIGPQVERIYARVVRPPRTRSASSARRPPVSRAERIRRRLRQFVQLSALERRSLAAAVIVNPVMLHVLRHRGTLTAIGLVDRCSQRRLHRRRMVITPEVIGIAGRVGRSVNRAAADPAPAVTCLARSLTAQLLLQRRGIETDLRIGVAPGDGSIDAAPLSFHAWAEVGGTPINDAGDVATVYAAFPIDRVDVLPLDLRASRRVCS